MVLVTYSALTKIHKQLPLKKHFQTNKDFETNFLALCKAPENRERSYVTSIAQF